MLILQGVPPLCGANQGWGAKNKTFTIALSVDILKTERVTSTFTIVLAIRKSHICFSIGTDIDELI